VQRTMRLPTSRSRMLAGDPIAAPALYPDIVLRPNRGRLSCWRETKIDSTTDTFYLGASVRHPGGRLASAGSLDPQGAGVEKGGIITDDQLFSSVFGMLQIHEFQ